jgi:hypothetical protein
MTAIALVVRPGLLVAIAATVIVSVAAAGCSKNTSGTGTSSTTGSPSSAGSPATTSAPSASSSPAVPSATAGARFIGHWHVHGATMDITSTTATIGVNHGPCGAGNTDFCSETDTLAVASGDDTQLTLKVTAVTYTESSGQTSSVVPNPSTGPSTAVGDSIQLVWQAPGLLKATVLQGFPGWQGGNPYWCGAGVSQSDEQRCGA